MIQLDTIAFAGTGALATPMIEHLLEQGKKVYIWNRTKEKTEPLAEQGAIVVSSLPELAQSSSFIVSIMSDDNALKLISAGEQGLIAHMSSAATHLSLATVGPQTAKDLLNAYAHNELEFISGVVFGRPDAIAQKTAGYGFSGKVAEKEQLTTFFKAIGGSRVFDFGERIEAANIMKLGFNFLIAAAVEAMGEGMSLVEKAGLDKKQFQELILTTAFASPIYKGYGQRIANFHFDDPAFHLSLGKKDIGLAQEVAEELSVPLPLAELLMERHQKSEEKGRGSWDWAGFSQVIFEEAGLL